MGGISSSILAYDFSWAYCLRGGESKLNCASK